MTEAAPFFAEVADGPPDGRAVWLKAASARIRAAVWNAGAARGTVFLLPGRTEYIEKYGRAAGVLAHGGYATLSVDWRGQGLADRALADPMMGHVGDFSEYQDDLDRLIAFAAAQGLPRPWHMLAHSMGGSIGLRGLMRRKEFRSAAFSAPMWGILMAGWIRPFAPYIALSARYLGRDHVYAPTTGPISYVAQVPFQGNTLTTDPEMWDYMKRQAAAHPRLSLGGPSMAWLRAALKELTALARMPSPAVPAICALGDREKIVATPPILARMARWPGGRLDLYAACEHEVMMEKPATRDRFLASAVALFDANR